MNFLWIDTTTWVFVLILGRYLVDVKWIWILLPLFFFHSLAPAFVTIVLLSMRYIYSSKIWSERMLYSILLFIWLLAGFIIRDTLLSNTLSGMNEVRLVLAIGLFLLTFTIVIGEKGLWHWALPFLLYIIIRLLELYGGLFGLGVNSVVVRMLSIVISIASLFIIQLKTAQFWSWVWFAATILMLVLSWKIAIFGALLVMGEKLIPDGYRDLFRIMGVIVLFWSLLYG